MRQRWRSPQWRVLLSLAAFIVLLGGLLSLQVGPAQAVPAPVPTPPEQALTFTPVADAYVDSSYPDRHFGLATRLIVDGSPLRESYLKFELNGLSRTVRSARLRLYVTADLA